MAMVDGDWSVDRATGDIRYGGDDHTGTAPSYATVIQFHRWLQELAAEAVAVGDDELDITNLDPSARSTDNIITLKNGYNITDAEAEHLYDGTIIQDDGDTIYDGIVNYGNSDITIQVIQDGAVVADDWWNHRDKVYGDGGLNYDDAQGISHRFMIKVRTGGADTDGRRLIGTARRFGYTYQEFRINGTNRGNNVLALSDGNDLNNNTAVGTVATWTTIVNQVEGFVALDVDADGSDENYYSRWTKAAYTINQLYERAKYLTRDGETATMYGIAGELFRGITHQIPYSSLSGTFDEGYPVSWSGTNSGTGQVLADDGLGILWIQLLTGVAPANGDSLSQTSPDSASATAGTVVDRSSLISKPFIGQSTGTAIIGAYGIGVLVTDLTNADKLFDLTNTDYSPPTLVTLTLTGLVSGEDRVLVGPWDGVTTDGESNPVLEKDQLSLDTALTTDNITQVEITESIPIDTPSTGYIRVTDNDGFERRLHYTAWENGTPNFFTIDTTDGNEDFASVNASAGNDVYISYLDALASAGTMAFQCTYGSDRDLVVIVRDGGAVNATPIKQFVSAWSITNASKSLGVIRTSDL